MGKWTCTCNNLIDLRFNRCPYCRSKIPDIEIRRIAELEYRNQKKYFKDKAIERNNFMFTAIHEKYILKRWIMRLVIVLSVILLFGYSYFAGFDKFSYYLLCRKVKNTNIVSTLNNINIHNRRVIADIKKINGIKDTNVRLKNASIINRNLLSLFINRKSSDFNFQDLKVVNGHIKKIIDKMEKWKLWKII